MSRLTRLFIDPARAAFRYRATFKGARSRRLRLAVPGTALLVTAAGCWERQQLTAPDEGDRDPWTAIPAFVAAVSCTANVDAKSLSCAAPEWSGGEDSPDLVIVGGQGVNVLLTSSSVSYDPLVEIFKADVTVQNLMAQTLGTINGFTPTGVTIFFHSGPNVTDGQGLVTVRNPDGWGSFTGSSQPYHVYPQILRTGVTSGAKTWEWDVQQTVNTFQFEVYVQAEVPAAISITPEDWSMPAGEQVAFNAYVEGSGSTITWAVNGITGGNAQVGTITAVGLYTAPSSPPAGGQVTVRATLTSSGAYAEAPVTITTGTEQSRILWHLFTPRSISQGAMDSVLYEVSFSGYPSLQLELASGSWRSPLAARSGIYAFKLEASQLISGYLEGDLHSFVGYLHCADCARVRRGNVFINVKDATVSSVPVTRLADDVQVGTHVVNIRYDNVFLASSIPAEILQRFYQLLPDQFDFIAIVEQVNSFNNRSYRSVRNDTYGLGLGIFDRSADYGSGGRLQGMIDYPISTFFDLGERAAVHEIAHRWMAFLQNPLLAPGIPHWPVSDIAYGITGYSDPTTRQGLQFPYQVANVGGNMYQLVCSDLADTFNDLELYLIGLIPPESVSTHVVFDNQNIPLTCGSTGTTSAITIGDIVAVNGSRDPSYQESPKTFTVATIVLSKDRLLSAEELAFFSHMAERGEAETELRFTSGFSSGITKPWYLATGERATLSTRLWP